MAELSGSVRITTDGSSWHYSGTEHPPEAILQKVLGIFQAKMLINSLMMTFNIKLYAQALLCLTQKFLPNFAQLVSNLHKIIKTPQRVKLKPKGFGEVIKKYGRQSEHVNYWIIFCFSPAEDLVKTVVALYLRADEMKCCRRSFGTLSHYQCIGSGITGALAELRRQIRGTKPHGLSSSADMYCAINFIICLQMRSTLSQSLECV